MNPEIEIYRAIGQRVKRIREQLKMSQEELAERMDYRSAATVSHFESGLRKISIADLQKLSTIFEVSLDTLVNEEKNQSNAALQIFRLRAKIVKPDTQDIVAGFLAFAQNHVYRPKKILLTPSELKKPRFMAEKLLSFVGWKDTPVSPRELAKNLNLSVFDWDFPDEICGVFAPTEAGACIGVNRYHSHVRQNFTIAHELGHWLYHDSKLQIDFSHAEILASSDEESAKEERKANQFAADLLMPKQWIERDFRGPDNLRLLANRYQVSEQALWYRLVTLRLIDDKQYSAKPVDVPTPVEL